MKVSAAAYRKRLSRARKQIVGFTRSHCGLSDPRNACRCGRRVERAVQLGRVVPTRLLHAKDASRAREFPEVIARIRTLEELRRAAALFRSHPEPGAGFDLTSELRELLDGPPGGG